MLLSLTYFLNLTNKVVSEIELRLEVGFGHALQGNGDNPALFICLTDHDPVFFQAEQFTDKRFPEVIAIIRIKPLECFHPDRLSLEPLKVLRFFQRPINARRRYLELI